MMTFGDIVVLTIVVVKFFKYIRSKFNFTVALSGNADILGILVN
jgi:hypothetical protein